MATGRYAGVARWYSKSTNDAPLTRFMCDLISDELSRLRPGSTGSLPPPWATEMVLDEDGLGLDSLERLSVATALSEALHLHESGLEDLLLSRRRFGEWVEVVGRSLDVFDRRLTFRTSGSSGLPKPCHHSLEDLESETDHWANLLRDARRILCAVPSHHIYGFIFTVLLPARLPDVQVLDIRRRTAPSLARDMREGDVVIGHPAFWTLVLRHVAAIAPGVVGVTSTAPCPADVANGLQAAGLSRLLQIYGSSETAGLGWRSSATEPYRLLPHWERVCLLEHEAESVSGAPRSDNASNARLRRKMLDAKQVPDSQLREIPDHVDWVDESQFRVLGRLDAGVQVGGINVFLERVRMVLLDHPCVADAAVRPMTGSEGNRLKAFVVLNEGTARPKSDMHAQLTDWVTTRLRDGLHNAVWSKCPTA